MNETKLISPPIPEPRADSPRVEELEHAIRLLYNEASKGSALRGSYVQVGAWLKDRIKDMNR